MTHEKAVKRFLKRKDVGVEIGAFETPVPLIKPFYVDRFAEFADRACLADYWGDACHVPFRNNSLDYVVTSHVLEHVANPVAALLEWHRVLKNNGLIYMVVPDRRNTFDHKREPTTAEHMWADFEAGVSQKDSTHVHEFLANVDWSLFWEGESPDQVAAKQDALRKQYLFDKEQGKEFNMHFHVFEESNVRDLISLVAERKQLSWKILELRSRFPQNCANGILVVVRIRKNFSDSWSSLVNGFKARRNRMSVLSEDAKPLSEFEEMVKIYA